MTTFQISNKTSGVDLGWYEGETAADAIAEMCRAAGYASVGLAASVTGQTVEAFVADLVVTADDAELVADIANILRNHGEWADGGSEKTRATIAREWADAGYDDDAVRGWLNAGVCSPEAAQRFEAEGFDSDDAARKIEWTDRGETVPYHTMAGTCHENGLVKFAEICRQLRA